MIFEFGFQVPFPQNDRLETAYDCLSVINQTASSGSFPPKFFTPYFSPIWDSQKFHSLVDDAGVPPCCPAFNPPPD